MKAVLLRFKKIGVEVFDREGFRVCVDTEKVFKGVPDLCDGFSRFYQQGEVYGYIVLVKSLTKAGLRVQRMPMGIPIDSCGNHNIFIPKHLVEEVQ